MADVARVPFTVIEQPDALALWRPILRVTLESRTHEGMYNALVDSGADTNVLPHSLGLALGLNWDDYPVMGSIGGAASRVITKAVQLQCQISNFPKIPLVFAWTETDNFRLILGIYDFFESFDVSFFRSRGYFEISPKQS